MTETEKIDLYLAGMHDGMRLMLAVVAEKTPFPFKANPGDRNDIEGPFCNNGIEDDATIERVERIVGHYLLSVRGEAHNTLTHTFLHLYDVGEGKARTGDAFAPMNPLSFDIGDRLRELMREHLKSKRHLSVVASTNEGSTR